MQWIFLRIGEHRSGGVVAGRINETPVHSALLDRSGGRWWVLTTKTKQPAEENVRACACSWMTVDEENVHADVYTMQYSTGVPDGSMELLCPSSHHWSASATYVCILADEWRPYRMSPRTYVQLVLYGKHDGRMCLLACNCNKQLCISQL